MEELEKGLKELRGCTSPRREQHCQQAIFLRDWTTSQRIHVEGPVCGAGCTCGRGWLVGHQWEERPLGLRVFDVPVQGNARVGGWEWVDGGSTLIMAGGG